MAIRHWAQQDKEAERAVNKANQMRLDYVRHTLEELGFSGEEAEMRAMMYVCYVTWEPHMFRNISKKKRRSLIAARVKMLTRL